MGGRPKFITNGIIFLPSGAHRKQRRLTLETVSGLGNLSMRFLSEFERDSASACCWWYS
jgi:hypothetical protein